MPKMRFWTDEEREAILSGEKVVSQDEIFEIVRRPIIAQLDQIMNMRVHGVVFGRGKFNNRGAGKTVDKDGNVTYEQEFLPIKDRMTQANELVKLLLATTKGKGGDGDLTPDQLLGDAGMISA